MLKFIYYLFILSLITVIGIGAYIFITIKNLPNPELFDQRQINQSTKIYDRTGKILLYEIHGEEKRTLIPFEEIPESVKQATIAIEDSQFYEHPAFDWHSILRAFLINLSNGRIVQGGSTITQQLAKNAFLTPEKTIARKIKELVLSFELEKKYSKDEILGFYLNQIPYGSNAYGIEAAAETFFLKHASELNKAEAALLASLPQSPTYYSPYGTHVKALMSRKNKVIEAMEKSGYISKKESEKIKKYKLDFAPQTTGIKAPHFVTMTREYLNNKYGEDFVQNSGLRIITTLDWKLQQLAEKVVREGVERNKKLYNGKNAALVAQDPKTGQILALVGSYNYFDTNNDGNFNVATQGLRQPGSAIKPFVYITAFKKGYTPDTILFDVKTDFDTTNTQPYEPQNFDKHFRGPVTLRQSLAQSINIPSVKLLYLAGIGNVLKTVEEFGISTLTEKSRYGLSLALGGGEIKLIELVGAYSVFSQDGIRHKQQFILKVQDSDGKILEEYKDASKKIIDSQYIRLINDILTDIETRKGLYQKSLYLTIFPNQEVALKTGTSNDYRDAWALGYTPSLVVGVWAGNNDNSPLQRKGSSILAALPMWSAFLSEALKTKQFEPFERPEVINVDKPILKNEYIINDEIHNILYYVDKNNPRGPEPSDPSKDPQYQKWENALLDWLQDNSSNLAVAIPNSNLSINIAKPKNGSFISGILDIEAEIKSSSDIVKIEVYLNDMLISQKSGTFNSPYTYQETFRVNKIELQNILKIKVLNSASKEIEKSIIIYKK